MSLPALYTAEETAAKLKVTRRAVYRWLSTGKLKGLRIGEHWRIAEEELMNFMSYSTTTTNNTSNSNTTTNNNSTTNNTSNSTSNSTKSHPTRPKGTDLLK